MLKWAAPAALLAVFFLQSFFATRVKSPTADEPAHLAAGLDYVSNGTFYANPQHPPLIKELAGLSMRAAGIRWLQTPTANDIAARPGDVISPRDWDAGEELLAQYGPDRVLQAARFPMPLVGLLLGVVLYLWALEMLGPAAALGALFLFAFDPTLIGHSGLVTTDVGLAAFGLLFLYALWKHEQSPSLARQIGCGVALGCALGAKYSAVLLLPIAGLLLLIGAVRRMASGVPSAAPNQLCPCGSGKKYKVCHALEKPSWTIDRARVVSAARALAVMGVVAVLMIELFYGFRASPLAYLHGLQRVNADHNPDYQAFLAGQAQNRYWYYFAAVYLLKEPLASILLCVAGCWIVLRGKQYSATTRWFLLMPPAVLFLAYSASAANLGIRYIIPVMVFLYMAGGAALAWLVGKRTTWARATAAVLGIWVVVAAAGIYPDHLSYFNESACVLTEPSLLGLDGGSKCGTMWLDDHNVDWGQGLKQLKVWLDANAQGRPVHIAYMGMTKPELYGIQHTPPPPERTGNAELYVFSGHHLARLSWNNPDILRTRPLAIVGHAFYIFP
jgi:hypothetical protein